MFSDVFGGRAKRPLAEFLVVTGFNALTLGGALVLYGHAVQLGRVQATVAAHATSATLSFAFCRFVVWRHAALSPAVEARRAGGFFLLAGISAAASVALTEALAANSRSLYFVAANYLAVGVIAGGKFVLQRALMTGSGRWRRGRRPEPASLPVGGTPS